MRPGPVVTVRTDADSDARNTGNGGVYSGVVNKNVYDGDIRIAIPKGSDVELMVRDAGKHSPALELDAKAFRKSPKNWTVKRWDIDHYLVIGMRSPPVADLSEKQFSEVFR